MSNVINITDVLSTPTQSKPETGKTPESKPAVPNSNDFDDAIESALIQGAGESIQKPLNPQQPTDQPQPEAARVVEDSGQMSDEEAEDSAEALVDMINMIQKSVFVLWGAKKEKKKIPKDLMEEFISLDIRDLRGEELNEQEKKKLKRYHEFAHRIDRIAQDIPFTEQEKAEFMACTSKFVQHYGVKIPPGVWFGVKVAEALSKRVIDIALR